LNAGLNPLQKVLVAVLPRLLPNLRVGNGLDAAWISHDPQQVAAYRSDPLVHDRIAARLARYIADGGAQVIAQADRWSVRTLLMYAGADHLVQPQGSRAFAALAPAEVVDSHEFAMLYHELFNESEPGRSHVLATLKQWLDTHWR
jgi:alpha-beta hydrolase superfamily lysophospholipase